MTEYYKGDRVQLHPCTDAFMRGQRYGTVVSNATSIVVTVKPDRGATVLHLPTSNVELVRRSS